MDNRLKFLYCAVAELWGRMCKGRAGNGKTGVSAGGVGEEKPPEGADGVMRSEKK